MYTTADAGGPHDVRVQWRHELAAAQCPCFVHSACCLICAASQHRPSVHDCLLRQPTEQTRKYDADVVVPDWLIYLGILISGGSRAASCAAVSDGTEVGCVLSGATKSAGTLSIQIWLVSGRSALRLGRGLQRRGSKARWLRTRRLWHRVWFVVSVRRRYTQQYYDRSELIRAPWHTRPDLVVPSLTLPHYFQTSNVFCRRFSLHMSNFILETRNTFSETRYLPHCHTEYN